MKPRATHNPRPKLRNPNPEKLDALLYQDKMRSAHNAPLSDGAIEARRLIAAAQLKYKQQQENAVPDMKTAIHTAMSAQRKASIKEVVDAWSDDDTPITHQIKQPEKAAMTSIHAKDENNRLFTETKGTSRATFAYIKANPYRTTTEAVNALYAMGHKKNSTTALFSAMIQQGIVSKDKDGKLTAMVDEYVPIKHNQQIKLANAVRAAARAGSVIKAKTTLSTKIMEHVQKNPPSWPERQAPTVTIDVRAIKNRNTPEGIASLNATVAQATPAAQAAPAVQATPVMLTAEQVLKTMSIKEAHVLYRELQTMFGG